MAPMFFLLAAVAATAPDVADVLLQGQSEVEAGRAQRAQTLYRTTLGQLGLSDDVAEDRASLFSALADAKLAQGRKADAVGALEAAHEILSSALGPNHPKVGGALGRLADGHAAAGDHGMAADLFGQLVRGMKAQGLGPLHPGQRHALTKHAAALTAAGRSGDAIKVYEAPPHLVFLLLTHAICFNLYRPSLEREAVRGTLFCCIADLTRLPSIGARNVTRPFSTTSSSSSISSSSSFT